MSQVDDLMELVHQHYRGERTSEQVRAALAAALELGEPVAWEHVCGTSTHVNYEFERCEYLRTRNGGNVHPLYRGEAIK